MRAPVLVAAESLAISDDHKSESCVNRELELEDDQEIMIEARTLTAFSKKTSVRARICAGPNAGFYVFEFNCRRISEGSNLP